MTQFAKGDRVTVVDLRTGDVHKGVVIRTEREVVSVRTRPGKVVVNYDDGAVVRVGETFVRHDDNPPEGITP